MVAGLSILGFLTPGNFSNECNPVDQAPSVKLCEATKGKIRTYRSKVRVGERCHTERERRRRRREKKEKEKKEKEGEIFFFTTRVF
jgi:nucleosome binding factor SPN SPT16 subunit